MLPHSRFFFAALLSISFFWMTACTSKKTPETPYTLNWVSKERVKGLDPALADDLYSGRQVGFAYEGLLQYHYLKRPYTLTPALAESLPEVSADGLNYTFKIKKGVLFQDDPSFKNTQGKGRELTAEDFVYSFKRLADPQLLSGNWWILDGKIAGLNEWRELSEKKGKADYTLPVEGIQALNRYTLKIKLTRKSHQFAYFLAMPPTSVVPQEAVEHYGPEFQNHAVGTGPFRLAEFQGNSKIIWLKNPTFRKELYPHEGDPGDEEAGLLKDAGKPLPLVEKVIVQIMTEEQPRWLNFLAGKLDLVEVPKDAVEKAVTPEQQIAPDLKLKGMRLVLTPQLEIARETFNLADPLFAKNKLLRQAIALAIDSAQQGKLFYGGLVEPAQGPIPPYLNGHDPTFKNPYRQHNIAKARELLAKAGYPGGQGLPPLEYLSLPDSMRRQMGEYLQRSLAEIGVQINISTHAWPDFQQKIRNKKGQMWGWAWGADYPDAENFLQLFYSKNVSPGPNDANYINTEFDRLYEKALSLPDGPARTLLYKKMVALLAEDTPCVFHYHRLFAALLQPWLKNYKFGEFDHFMFKYYGIDPALKSGK